MKPKKVQIAVIGSAGNEEYSKEKPDKNAFKIAFQIGKLVAQNDAVLICGGKGGIMKEACRGAKEADGITVGIISGNERNMANEYVDVEVVSGAINSSEEALIISMSDGVIAIGGGSGTLEELALAYRNEKPVVAITGVRGWAERVADTYLDERELIKIESATTADQAVALLMRKIG